MLLLPLLLAALHYMQLTTLPGLACIHACCTAALSAVAHDLHMCVSACSAALHAPHNAAAHHAPLHILYLFHDLHMCPCVLLLSLLPAALHYMQLPTLLPGLACTHACCTA
jgi:hypothetical protein